MENYLDLIKYLDEYVSLFMLGFKTNTKTNTLYLEEYSKFTGYSTQYILYNSGSDEFKNEELNPFRLLTAKKQTNDANGYNVKYPIADAYLMYDPVNKSFTFISNYGQGATINKNPVQSIDSYPLLDEFSSKAVSWRNKIPLAYFNEIINNKPVDDTGTLIDYISDDSTLDFDAYTEGQRKKDTNGITHAPNMTYQDYIELPSETIKLIELSHYVFYQFNLFGSTDKFVTSNKDVLLFDANSENPKYEITGVFLHSKISPINHTKTLLQELQDIMTGITKPTISTLGYEYPSDETTIVVFNSNAHSKYIKELLSKDVSEEDFLKYLAISYKRYRRDATGITLDKITGNDVYSNMLKKIMIKAGLTKYIHGNEIQIHKVIAIKLNIDDDIHSYKVDYKKSDVVYNYVGNYYYSLLLNLTYGLKKMLNKLAPKEYLTMNAGAFNIPIDLELMEHESEFINGSVCLFEEDETRFKKDLYNILLHNGNKISTSTFTAILPTYIKNKINRIQEGKIMDIQKMYELAEAHESGNMEEIANGIDLLQLIRNTSPIMLNPLEEIIRQLPSIKEISPYMINILASNSHANLQSDLASAKAYDDSIITELKKMIKSAIKMPKTVVNNIFTAKQELTQYRVILYEYTLALDIFIKLFQLVKRSYNYSINIESNLTWPHVQKMIELFKVKMYSHFHNLREVYKREVIKLRDQINEKLGADTVREKLHFLERKEIDFLTHADKIDLFREDLEIYLERLVKVCNNDELYTKYNTYIVAYENFMQTGGKNISKETFIKGKTIYYDPTLVDQLLTIVLTNFNPADDPALAEIPEYIKAANDRPNMSFYNVLSLPILYILKRYPIKEPEAPTDKPDIKPLTDILDKLFNCDKNFLNMLNAYYSSKPNSGGDGGRGGRASDQQKLELRALLKRTDLNDFRQLPAGEIYTRYGLALQDLLQMPDIVINSSADPSSDVVEIINQIHTNLGSTNRSDSDLDTELTRRRTRVPNPTQYADYKDPL